MNPRRLFLPAACLLMSACAHQAPPPPPPPPLSAQQAAAIEHERREYERYGREYERERNPKVTAPPRIGMTREQVRAEFGRPFSITAGPRFEIWKYTFNGTDARPTSPFHDAAALIQCVVYFRNSEGKVSNYSWTASKPR